MLIHDLGSIVVDVEGRVVDLGSTKQAALLARLIITPNRAVSSEALTAAGWGPDAVVSASSLDSQLWRLRNVVQPSRGRSSSILVRSGSGYRLDVEAESVDSARFVRLSGDIESMLAQSVAGVDVLGSIEEALRLWRGTPYGPIADLPEVAPAVTRLEELYGQLADRRIEALVAAGQPDRALADLEPLLAATPYRERLWAHRMRILADLGRTEEALTTYQRVRDLLRDELGLDPGSDLQELQTQLLSGDRPRPVDRPRPARSAEVRLPRRATRLHGRKRDLERVVALLGEHPLVTLVGAGGCGKTRLAVEVAATTDDFPDGVWFVDLTTVTDPAQVVEVVITTLGLGASPIDDPLQMLTSFLADKRLLLIMDNCEHLLDGAANTIEAVLAAADETVVVATSREPLQIEGEIVWSLSPLSTLNHSADAHEPQERSPAVELFLERARTAAPDLAPSSEELAAAERICHAVDGLPLAIELAAARARTFTLAEIADQVAADPTRLARIGRSRVDHRNTLYDAIEWSYRLLTPQEQTLHRLLSVLPGAFTLSAAIGVAAKTLAEGTVAEADRDIAQNLATLVHSSMLGTKRSPGRPTTFAQLDTVRAHARRRLVDAGEEPQLVAQRDAWVKDLLARRPAPGRLESATWFEELDQAYGIVRSCLHDHLRLDGDPELVRLGSDLVFYWYYRSRVVEGGRWLEAAQTDGPPPQTEVQAGVRLLRLATVSFLRNRRDLATVPLTDGLAHLDSVPDESVVDVGGVLVGLAAAAWGCLAYEVMLDLHERLRPLAERADDPNLDLLVEMIGCAAHLTSVAVADSKQAADGLFDRGYQLDNPFVQWMAALLRTGVATVEQNPADGVEWTKRLVSAHLRLGNGGGSVFLESLANYSAMSGDFVEAARLYAGGVAAARRAGTAWPTRPETPPLYEQTRSALDPHQLAAATEAGANVTLEDLATTW